MVVYKLDLLQDNNNYYYNTRDDRIYQQLHHVHA